MSKHHASNWCKASKRIGIYFRDNWTCVYCARKFDNRLDLSLDHIVPASTFKKGDPNKNHESNLVTCCHACNNAKSDLSLESFVKDTNKRMTIILRAKNVKIDRNMARKWLADNKLCESAA